MHDNQCKTLNCHQVFWQITPVLHKVILRVELIQPQVISIIIIWLIVIQLGIAYKLHEGFDGIFDPGSTSILWTSPKPLFGGNFFGKFAEHTSLISMKKLSKNFLCSVLLFAKYYATSSR